ncbi:M23 family metallopeptidase [Piscinibacter koreensis]
MTASPRRTRAPDWRWLMLPVALAAGCKRVDVPAPVGPASAPAPASAPTPVPAPPPPASAPSAPEASGGALLIPVPGVAPGELNDMFDQSRGGGERAHEAIDIMAPHGTPVHAVADGTVAKLFDSKPGGITLYQFDPTGTYAYYYAHLAGYAPGIREGMQLRRGDLIGYVGSTGNARPDAPHLHFALFKLGPERQWWKGTPINPYPLLVPKTR